MRPLQYLDTARLGQMTSAAKDAQLDFVRLSSEEPSSLYFEEFLRHGFNAWPTSYQDQFPGLQVWRGVTDLKRSIRRLAGAPEDWRVLLAQRSLSLMSLGCRCQFRVCRHVMTTDLSWPTNQGVLEATARSTHNRVTVVPLRDAILTNRWSAEDVRHYLADQFDKFQCDGLFLPAVDHLGIHMPVRDIVEEMGSRREVRFCLIDAAQAVGHVSLADCVACADFIVAGTHKWLGAYLPMGIGLFGRSRSRHLISQMLNRLNDNRQDRDPLSQFTEQLETGTLNGVSETVNITPLITCAGALSDHLSRRQVETPLDMWGTLSASDIACPDHWQPVRPDESLQSRIVLFQSRRAGNEKESADDVRRIWLEAGAVVTGYDRGVARLSWPFPAEATRC